MAILEEAEPMSEVKPQTEMCEFGADDALAIARNIVEIGRDAQAHFSESAVSTIAAIILWEALKASREDEPS